MNISAVLPVTVKLFFLTVTVLTLFIDSGCKKSEQVKTTPPPVEVVAIPLQAKTIPLITPFVAQTVSSHQVDIMPRVSGFLEKIVYTEGAHLKTGQVMFQIDKKPFLAQLNSAKAEVEIRESQLFTAKANLNRIKPLADLNAASKSDLDNAIGSFKSAEAAVQQAKAVLQKAELDLGYTTITSPVNGIASQSLLREGAYISAGGGANKLTYVAKIDPIWVEFSISQNELADFNNAVKKGELIKPANSRYTVQIELPDGSTYPHQGSVNFADPSFSKDTGTFLVRAELPNSAGQLKPGMFVKANLKGATRPNAITVPQKAVQQTPNGHVVFLVNDKSQVEIRPVITGSWFGDDWIISHGLKTGEKVIIDGFQKVGPGMPVKVVTLDEMNAAKAAAAASQPAQTAK